MKKQTTKKLLVLSMISVITACSTNVNQNQLSLNNNQTISTFSNTTVDFVNNLETGDMLIDEEFYKKYPDKFMANTAINQIQSGIVPEYPKTLASQNDVKAQSLLSVFNRNAYIDIYDSYGSSNKVTVTGRVYKKRGIKVKDPKASDGKIKNLLRNIRFFVPNGVNKTSVSVNINGKTQTVKTDSKGFFTANFVGGNFKNGVNNVQAKLVGSNLKYTIPTEQVVIDNIDSNKYAVISDIDDTVKVSKVDSKLQMIKKIFLGNYKTDKKILGVSTLYKGILNESNGTAHYVTGSPIHLYSRIQNFLKLNNFPQGSLGMKKLVLFYKGSDPTTDQLAYKLNKVRGIIKAYPKKKFLLFGDTTQQDADVYKKIKQEFPNNVSGIYINNVTNQKQTNPRFQGVMLTNSTIDSAKDLFNKGIITQETLNKVISEVKY